MSDESMVGGDGALTATKPPLGSPNPAPAAPSPAAGVISTSIVDTILNLDELLSADVRRAEKSVTIYLRPELEAEIDARVAELELLTDSAGNPLPLPEAGLDEARSPQTVATEIQALIHDYAASGRRIVFRQMPSDEWEEFLTKHKGSDKPGEPRPKEFWNDLIAAAALVPAMTVAQLVAVRKQVGHPQMTSLGNAAWEVNAYSGVSIPKSPLSSHVLGRSQRGMS